MAIRMKTPALLLLGLLAAPLALAHEPAGTPNLDCALDQNPHDYTTSANVVTTGFSPVTDMCAMLDSDHDPEWGIGAAYLKASHHGSTVCVVDVVLGDQAEFVVGADGNGDGLITDVAPDNLTPAVTGCISAGFPPGVDDAWWVFVHAPAVGGHVFA